MKGREKKRSSGVECRNRKKKVIGCCKYSLSHGVQIGNKRSSLLCIFCKGITVGCLGHAKKKSPRRKQRLSEERKEDCQDGATGSAHETEAVKDRTVFRAKKKNSA